MPLLAFSSLLITFEFPRFALLNLSSLRLINLTSLRFNKLIFLATMVNSRIFSGFFGLFLFLYYSVGMVRSFVLILLLLTSSCLLTCFFLRASF